MVKKFVLALTIVVAFIMPGYALPELSFSTITVADGLNSSRIFAVSQDSDGFMWFGTDNGVSRFDGKTFRHYLCDRMGVTGLSDSYVNCICKLEDGRLLLGTRRGVNVYKPIEDRFELLHLSAYIDGEEVRTLYEWGESLYIGTNTGLYIVDKVSGHLTRSFSTADSGLPHDIVRCLYCDGRYLFVGTFDGFCRYDLTTEEWITVDLKNRSYDLRNNLILSIIPSPFDEGKLLVGSQTGLCEVDRISLGFKIYDARNNSMNNVTIKTMCRVKDEVWMGTEDGLIVWDGNQFANYTYNPQYSHSIVNNIIWDVFKDSKGGIWLATDNGVSYYDSNIPAFSKVDLIKAKNNPNAGIEIFDAVVDLSGNIWLSSKAGFAKYSPEQNAMQWKEVLAGKLGLYNFIRSLYIDSEGIIWIGTSEGLWCYDTVRERFEDIQAQLKHKLKYTVSVTSDSDGRVYATTTNGNTQIIAYSVDVAGGIRINSEVSVSVNDQITSLVVSGNNLWYGTSNNGVIRKNIATGQLKRYYSQPDENGGMNMVKSMCIGQASRALYAGTANGIFIYDEDEDSFQPFFSSSMNTEILTMEEDGEGNLWYTTPHYIACLSVKDGTSQRFSMNSWFDKRNNLISASCVKGDDVYMLGTDSYLKVNIKDVRRQVEPQNLLISELKINDIQIEQMGIIDVPLTKLKCLKLRHDQNNLAFAFAMLDYSAPTSVIYKYRLKGYDNWKVCNGLQNNVVYSMLPSGRYILQVSALSGLGIDSGNTVEMEISIASPPWLSWWAILCYMLAISGIMAILALMVGRRRQISNDLARAKMEKENAESLSNLKLQFFTNVSHDFRTPISLILSPVETLIESETDEHKLNYLNIIKTNSMRLLTLVNQILDFRKMESEKPILHLASGDIVSELRGIIASFADMASKKNIFIDFDSAEKSLICDYDKKKIDKIFVNLISNAIKFTKDNGQIVISFRRKDSLGIEIMVADSGVGIAEKDLPHIFERFYSVDNFSSLGSSGTGLGLMIVKNLVELHGGTVSVYSKVGVGSTFIVNLPIVHELQNAADKYEEPVFAPVEKTHNYSVLVVEDDDNMRGYLVSELGKYYDILPFSNAEDALLAMDNLMPDLIISDVMLGEDRMSGTDFCRRLRTSSQWKTIPIILLTAVTTEDQVVEGFDSGANDYIGKPFNIHVLCTRIDNLLSQIQHFRDAINGDVLAISKSQITSPDEGFIAKLVALIEENIANPDLNIPFLCDRMAMSHVSFYRKVKSITGQNINSFVREIRLRKAAQMLQVNGITVTEAMYAVGFSHRSYFSMCFKEMFGITPKLYAKQFNNNVTEK